MVSAGHLLIFSWVSRRIAPKQPNGRYVMKIFITMLMLSIVTATSMLTPAAALGQCSKRSAVTQSPHIYWQGRDIGTDPDPNVWFELQRDANHYGAHY
jgi:hypothetical protein